MFNYFHTASFSQPFGNPIAAVSIEGKANKRFFNLSVISFWGEIMLRKYLMIHRLKKTFCWFTGTGIHGLVIFLIDNARNANVRFHTREWWQQLLRQTVTIVSHDINTGTLRENSFAICLRIWLLLILSYILVKTTNIVMCHKKKRPADLSIAKRLGGFSSYKCRNLFWFHKIFSQLFYKIIAITYYSLITTPRESQSARRFNFQFSISQFSIPSCVSTIFSIVPSSRKRRCSTQTWRRQSPPGVLWSI